jgi:hypothetical protein
LVAVSKSPVVSAVRMRVLETRSPSLQCTGSIACAVKPCAVAHRLQQVDIARAALAEAELRADPHFTRRQAVDQHLADEVLGRHRRQLRVEAQQADAVAAQVEYRPSSFARGSIRRGGLASFAKNSRGSGSKLNATAGRPSECARARGRAADQAWWPRCRPSKAPMHTTLPSGLKTSGLCGSGGGVAEEGLHGDSAV